MELTFLNLDDGAAQTGDAVAVQVGRDCEMGKIVTLPERKPLNRREELETAARLRAQATRTMRRACELYARASVLEALPR